VRFRALLNKAVRDKGYQVSGFSSETHFMGYQDDRLTGLPKVCDYIEHLGGHLRIQGRRGLIKQEELWLDRECSGNGDSLALTTAELRWFLAGVSTEAQALENSKRSLLRIRKSMNLFQRKQDILQGRQVWEEVIRLEDDADLAPMRP